MTEAAKTKPDFVLWLVAGLGLIWNLIGIYQFAITEFATKAQYIAAGMTPDQADFYLQLPVWMKFAFAIGVVAGSIGCILLILRRKSALTVLWVSLIAYISLYIADVVYGVFEILGSKQINIMTTVLAIAVGLQAYAVWLGRRSKLI
jgi:hypothetical protein